MKDKIKKNTLPKSNLYDHLNKQYCNYIKNILCEEWIKDKKTCKDCLLRHKKNISSLLKEIRKSLKQL